MRYEVVERLGAGSLGVTDVLLCSHRVVGSCARGIRRRLDKAEKSEGKEGDGGGGGGKAEIGFDLPWYWTQVLETAEQALFSSKEGDKNPFLALSAIWVLRALSSCVTPEQLQRAAKVSYAAMEVSCARV